MSDQYYQIAGVIATLLAPFLPYLVEGGKKFAGKAGEAAWEKARTIWEKIRVHFQNDQEIKGAALMVAAKPEDENYRMLLAKAIAARLENSPDFAKELEEIVGSASFQEISATQNSRIEDVEQKTIGGGKQSIKAKDKSVVKRSKQIRT